ncbi:hypothetical protein PR048_008270 [Dryococelus australis]|uniref:Uncharacterized protein n=1 Tax=Dryococelus australis TaxID=614101 RepID=A0ABQ9HWM1_9NEOP|nr:hypothetical protein PR048_008270 [Dryococelus australis]
MKATRQNVPREAIKERRQVETESACHCLFLGVWREELNRGRAKVCGGTNHNKASRRPLGGASVPGRRPQSLACITQRSTVTARDVCRHCHRGGKCGALAAIPPKSIPAEDKWAFIDAVSLLSSHQGDPGSIPGRVTPDFRMWESCRTMPLAGEFSRGSPVSPTLSFRRSSILSSITLFGSQDLDIKNHSNLLTHSLSICSRCLAVRVMFIPNATFLIRSFSRRARFFCTESISFRETSWLGLRGQDVEIRSVSEILCGRLNHLLESASDNMNKVGLSKLIVIVVVCAERRGSVKGDIATRIKSPIAAKRKALYWRALFSPCCVYLWDFQRRHYFIGAADFAKSPTPLGLKRGRNVNMHSARRRGVYRQRGARERLLLLRAIDPAVASEQSVFANLPRDRHALEVSRGGRLTNTLMQRAPPRSIKRSVRDQKPVARSLLRIVRGRVEDNERESSYDSDGGGGKAMTGFELQTCAMVLGYIVFGRYLKNALDY